MTEPDDTSSPPPSRDEELENVVDKLQDDVTEERKAEGVPGNVADREKTPTEGSEYEPPD